MRGFSRLIPVTIVLGLLLVGGLWSSSLAGGDFAGDWQTDWGRMNLAQKDGRVVGEYESGQDGQVVIGVIAGVIENGVLKGFWVQPGEKGEFEFKLSSDGNRFTGRWRHGMSGEWGAWSGKRL